MKATGTIKHWNDQKGYGFITKDDGSGDVFLHLNNVTSDVDSLGRGQRVEFEIAVNVRNGKSEAQNAVLL